MTAAAVIYALATVVIVAFQIAMALGAPWGTLAMGGKYPGRFPPALRIAALVQAMVLIVLGVIVLRHTGALSGGALLGQPWLIWVAVAFAAIATILNAITPSKNERALWFPVALIMLVSSIWAAATPQVSS